MSNRRRKERSAARRLRANQAKAVRRMRRSASAFGARGTAIAAAASLGLTLGAVVPPASAVTGVPELLADIEAGDGSSYPRHLETMGGFTYFAAEDSVNGAGLWKTDGTAAGTTLIKSLTTPGYGYGAENLTAVGGILFFTATDDAGTELWKSDGTTAGTVRVADIYAGVDSGYPEHLVDVGGTLFFTATDGTHGIDLWKSDGTEAGTVLVKDLPTTTYGYDRPYALTAVGNTLFFTASDETHGRELWTSDGTAAGTVMVKDILPNNVGGYYGYDGPSGLVEANGTLFFRADSGSDGEELWKSDGTETGTVMVKDLPAAIGSSPQNLTEVGTGLFFTGRSATGRQIWKSDGTTGGTVMVAEIAGGGFYGGSIDSLTDVGGRAFFSASDSTHGTELWISDGTAAGTKLVKDINPGTSDGAPYSLAAHQGRIFFTAGDAVHGRELWMSDGTSTGTTLVGDVFPGGSGSSPYSLTSLGQKLIFTATDADHGRELWQYTIAATPPAPSNQFTLPFKAKANAKKGFVTVKVTVPGPGVLRRGPAAGSPVRKGSTTIAAAGAVKVKVLLTRKGLKKLKRVGKMKVAISFTYTPTGGKALTKTKKYLFKYTG